MTFQQHDLSLDLGAIHVLYVSNRLWLRLQLE